MEHKHCIPRLSLRMMDLIKDITKEKAIVYNWPEFYILKNGKWEQIALSQVEQIIGIKEGEKIFWAEETWDKNSRILSEIKSLKPLQWPCTSCVSRMQLVKDSLVSMLEWMSPSDKA